MDERVVNVSKNDCSLPLPPSAPASEGWTVTRLFNQIGEYITQQEGTCGPNGCACNGPIRVQAIYDERTGYPQSVVVRADVEERWLFSLGGLLSGNCSTFPFRGDELQVLSVVPIR